MTILAQDNKVPISRKSRDELEHQLRNSVLGRRIYLRAAELSIPDDVVWQLAYPAIRLAAAIEHAVGRINGPLTVASIDPSSEDIVDQGRWLQFARALLGTTHRLQINIRLPENLRTEPSHFTTPFADILSDLPHARIRYVPEQQLFEPLQGRLDLLLVASRAILDTPYWESLPRIAPDVPSCMLADVDAISTLAAVITNRFEGRAEEVWLESGEWAWQDGNRKAGQPVQAGGVLHVIRRWPSGTVPEDQQAAIQRLVKAIFAACEVSSTAGVPLAWPGKRLQMAEADREDIFLDGLVFIDPTSGAVLSGHTQIAQCPPTVLSALPSTAQNPSFRPSQEELEWALNAAVALSDSHRHVQQLHASFFEHRDRFLTELGVALPAPRHDSSVGLFRHIQLNDVTGLMRAVHRGGDPDQRGPDRTTLLIEAVRSNLPHMVEALLSLGADPALRDACGWSLHEYAALDGNEDMLGIIDTLGGANTAIRPEGIPSNLVVACLLALHERRRRLLGGSPNESADQRSPEELVDAWRKGKWHGEMTAEQGVRDAMQYERPPEPDDLQPLESADALSEPALTEKDALPTPTYRVSEEAPPYPPEPLDAPVEPAMSLAFPEIAEEPQTPAPIVPAFETPRARAVGSRHPSMSVVSAVAVRLRTAPEQTVNDSLEAARAVVFEWLASDKRLPVPKPVPVDWHLDLAHASVMTDASDAIWALRFDDHDQSHAGRIWRTDIVLAKHDDAAYCNVRLVRICPADDDPDHAASSIPRLISRLATRIGLEDAGLPLRPAFIPCAKPESVEALIRLLLNPQRSQPVVVAASPDLAWAGTTGNASSLPVRLAGSAHLVHLEGPMTFALTRRLGRQLSVFGDAIRIYRPGFREDDDPSANPLVIRAPHLNPKNIIARVVEHTARVTAANASDDEIPSFALARTVIAKSRRKAAAEPIAPPTAANDSGQDEHWRKQWSDAIERLTQAEAELATVEQRSIEREATFVSRLEVLSAQHDGAREETDRLLQINRHLRIENERLRAELASQSGAPASAEPPIPDSLDELEAWAANYLRDDVIIAAKALRAARKSDFSDPPLVYRTLLMLLEHYGPMHMDPSDERRAAFKSACDTLGVEVSKTGRAVDDHRYREAYRVQWNGKTYKLDQHVSGSNSRDTSRVFRVYFAWDEDKGVVIVGHLPTHLPSSLTAH